MSEALLQSYRAYYGALGHVLLPRYALPHPAFRTSFVLSAGVIDMKHKLAGNGSGPPRCVLIQPCFRHFDVNSVITGTHLSLFLMGAALHFDQPHPRSVVETILQFLLGDLSIEGDRLWLTTLSGGTLQDCVIPGETDSAAAWSALRLSSDHVVPLGVEQNFWREGAGSGEIRSGLCGPHAEIFFDLGHRTCAAPSCIPGCTCGRFLEIANIVFPRFLLRDGRLESVPWLIAEAALGLDRVAMILESAPTVFDTRAMSGFKDAACRGALADMHDPAAIWIVLDHIRSFCCLIADGGHPSGKGRGHILRQLLRHAIRTAGQFVSDPCERLAQVAWLLLRHPEACCTIDVVPQRELILNTLHRELCLATHRIALEDKR